MLSYREYTKVSSSKLGIVAVAVILMTLSPMTLCYETTCVPSCVCKEDRTIECTDPNQLSDIPILENSDDMIAISKIKIEYQSNLTRLSASSLRHYTDLDTLSIENSGLSHIEPDAFEDNLRLRVLELAGNKLTTLSWRVTSGLQLESISVDNNPWECQCDIRWIADNIKSNLVNTRGKDLTCYDYTQTLDGKPIQKYISDLEFHDCEIPRVNVTPTEIKVNKSNSLVAVCEVSGLPEPEVHWDTSQLSSNFTIRRQSSLREELHIYDAHPRDTGRINCVGFNKAGSENGTFTLMVLSKPLITFLSELQKRFHFFIEYRVVGVPSPSITWFKDGVEVKATPSRRNVIVEEENSFIGITNGYLSFRMMNSFFNGNYTLIATNKYGSTKKSVYVDFQAFAIEKNFSGPMPPTWGNSKSTLHKPTQSTYSSEEDNIIYIATGVPVILILIFTAVIFLGLKRYRHNLLRNRNENQCNRKPMCPFFRIRKKRRISGPTPREEMPLTSMHIVDNPNYYPKGHNSSNTV